MRRTEDFLALFHLPFDRPGEAEIPDFRLRVEIQQNIRRLDVAVDDAVLVSMGEAVTNPGDEADDLRLVDRYPVGRVVNRLPGHILHHDVEHPIHLAEVIHADEIRVVQAGHRLGLRLEAGAERGVLAEFHRQYFQRHGAVQRPLHRAIDGTHAAGGDQALDVIPREKRRKISWLRRYESGWFLRIAHSKNRRKNRLPPSTLGARG